jgi:heat shock protein HslJ
MNWCNSYTADYTFDGDAVSIGMPAATMMMCESETAMAQESAYLAALPQVMTYAVEGVELVLSGPDGVPEIRYTTTMAVQQSAWLVDLLADAAGDLKPLLAGSEITASFDGNAIIGFDGCGNYTAKYATQGANIEIQTAVVSAAGVPPADCEPGGELAAQSDAYQGALTGAALFDISGVHLNMYDESGNQLLTFTAAEAQ